MTSLETAAAALRQGEDARESLNQQMRAWRNLLIRGMDPALFEKHLNEFHEAKTQARTRWQTLGGLLTESADMSKRVETILAAHAALDERFRAAIRTFQLSENNPKLEADAQARDLELSLYQEVDSLLARLRKIHQDAISGLEDLLRARQSELEAAPLVLQAPAPKFQDYRGIGLALMALLALGVWGLLDWMTAAPLKRMATALRERAAQMRADGEADAVASLDGLDEFAAVEQGVEQVLAGAARSAEEIQTLRAQVESLGQRAERDATSGLRHLNGLRAWFDARVAAAVDASAPVLDAAQEPDLDAPATAPNPAPSLARVFVIEPVEWDKLEALYGPQAALDLRQRMSERLEKALGANGAAAQWGAHGFVAALCDPTDADPHTQAQAEAGRIFAAFEKPFTVRAFGVVLRLRMGVAIAADGESLDAPLRRAWQALTQAAPQQSVALYDPTQDPARQGLSERMTQLREGVLRRELRLYFQPIVDLNRQGVGEVEALLRWEHPEQGVLEPGELIPWAEQTGVIREVTQWALSEAASRLVKWGHSGVSLDIAMNLSQRDLADPNFPERLGRLLSEHQISPRQLTFDIPAEAAFNPHLNLEQALDGLRRVGVGLALDNIGRGAQPWEAYSRWPLRQIKTAPETFAALNDAAGHEAAMQAMAAFGRHLGAPAVAKGIEDRLTLELARKMGFEAFQGFFISPPVDAVALLTWMRESPWSGAAFGSGGRKLSSTSSRAQSAPQEPQQSAPQSANLPTEGS
ncbi:putative diguanylate cyclase/phosphodiesterase with PAS/PAC sensor [Magnetofaba australis IT-1]|uniref:Putative diguanylate cyclase/phosphodiesterase with PAS/PAC sensor n=2 Tax=Magnetofaba TaxID=1472292 RepID=A0A1Y2K9V0_9PROT|nr:putative diguanylate cyclase/phosphodiesterase with PAS/PAC sensor [Magnetofaba australis IT-1]